MSRDPAGNPGRDGDRDPRHPADGRPPGFAGVPPAPRAAGYSRPSAWYPAGYQRTAYQPATNRFPLITESFPWDVAAPSPTGTGPFTRVADRHPRVRPSAPDDDGENRSAGYETGDWLPRYGRHRQVRGRAARADRRSARLAGPGGRERTRRHGPGGTRYAPQRYSIISSDPPATAPRPGPVAAARGPAQPRRAAWSRPFRAAQPFLPRPGKHHPARDVRPGFWLSGRTQAAAILVTLIVLGIAAEMIVSANNAGRQPSSAASPRFVPATLAGMDFVPYAAASTRGITQSQGRVASSGTEVVAVGAETGQRVPRAQFFVSSNGGRSWRLGSVTAAGGGTPPPGHAARFVAGGAGEWAAIGPDSIWTSADGQAWTLTSATGLPQQAGDQITVLKRTGSGFIAAGANVPNGNQAAATPVIFLSANGINWHRLGAGQLHLATGQGRALDLRLAAADGKLILIAGDIATPTAVGTGRSRHMVTVRTGGAWLSDDDGRSWTPASVPAGRGETAEFSDAAATAAGFLLVRPAVVDGVPAADVYRSGNGTSWTLAAALTTPAGFIPGLMNGGPDGAVLAGRSGQTLTTFLSPDGARWRQALAFGSASSEAVSGVAVTGAGAVLAAGMSTAQPGNGQQLITVTAAAGGARSLSLSAIPGAVEPQLAVNAVAAQGGTQVAVGSANGFPAAWISADGGRTWQRGTGQSPAVLDRPGIQQLTSVTHGSAGWLAVGGVTAGAPQHPVILAAADGTTWSAVDAQPAFAGGGLYTRQAAADRGVYVIVGYQQVPETTITASRRTVRSTRTIATAWWSAGLTGWHRAGLAAAGALDGDGSSQMLAVTATADGFVGVGAHDARPAAWMTRDGSTWTQAGLPLPAGAASAVLEHIAANGRTVVAIGMAQTAAGQVPFAVQSADGGASWKETDLPMPAGTTRITAGSIQVTALAAADGGFAGTGTFGTTPGQQDVVIWTSPDGTTWKASAPAGRGLAGPGVQAITGLTASGSMLTGVGFTASPASEQPILWRFRIR